MTLLARGRHQGGADRHRARHGDRGGRRPAFRDHDPAARRRDRRPPRQGRLHRRLGGRRRAPRLHDQRALLRRRTGRIYDPFGGLGRSRARRVRFVGEPEARIAEDVLRLLRFFRFHAHYGKPPPDAAALAACRSGSLPCCRRCRASGSRRDAEAAERAAARRRLDLMDETGVLAHFLPEATRNDRLRALVAIEGSAPATSCRGRIRCVGWRRCWRAAMPSALAVATRLRFSNAERDRLIGLAGDPDPSPDLDAPARRRLIYRLGPVRYRDRALIAWADGGHRRH